MDNFQVKMWLAVVAALSLLSLTAGLVCPPEESVAPAQCWSHEEGLSLEWGYPAGPEHIEILLTETRRANNMTADDWLPIWIMDFINFRTNFLDFRPLSKTIIDTLYIQNADYFYQIDGGELDASLEPTIKVHSVSTSLTPNLRDDGARQILSHIDPTSLRSLHLSGTVINGSCLEALRKFTGLEVFFASGVGYSGEGLTIPSGAFSEMPNLKRLGLAGAGITTLSDNQLLLSDEGVTPVAIALGSNELVAASFKPNHGLGQVKRRRVELDFYNGYMDTLEEATWKEFLDNNPSNKIKLNGNPDFVCDPRMRWIKDGRDLYIEQVLYAMCSNDRGKTVFTSELV